jgi:hypothetical protein
MMVWHTILDASVCVCLRLFNLLCHIHGNGIMQECFEIGKGVPVCSVHRCLFDKHSSNS